MNLTPKELQAQAAIQDWFDAQPSGPRWLNIGCGPHYADGFCNIDVHSGDGNHPDVVVPLTNKILVPDGSLDRVYAGHVLEHIPWDNCVEFLRNIRRALKPGGELLVVGPDLRRTLDLWKDGALDWHMVDAVWESDDAFMISDSVIAWEGARHRWNCTEERVVALLECAEFSTIEHRCIQNELVGDLRDWPIVAYTNWQLSVWARR